MKQISELFKQNKILPLLAGSLLILVILLLIVCRSCTQKRAEQAAAEAAAEAEAAAQQETLTVYDGTGEAEIIPIDGLPRSVLGAEDFSEENGIVTYSGSSCHTLQGIDVSCWQGDIDWQAVAEDGIDFVFIRIGYRGSREGNLYNEDNFETYLQGALEAGLQIGVYFYSQAVTVQEAEEEAQWVLDALNGRSLDLPVMFDWEADMQTNSRTADIDGTVMTECAEAFCNAVEADGYEAGLYFSLQQCYYSYDLSQLTDYAFWSTDPGTKPVCCYRIDFWQYSYEGSVAGIDGIVDRDMMFLYE